MGLLKEGDEFRQLTSPTLEHAALRVGKGREIGGEDFFQTLLNLVETGLEGALRISPSDLRGRRRTKGISEEILPGRGVGRGPVGGEEGLGLPIPKGVATNGFHQAHLFAFPERTELKGDGQGESPGIQP